MATSEKNRIVTKAKADTVAVTVEIMEGGVGLSSLSVEGNTLKDAKKAICYPRAKKKHQQQKKPGEDTVGETSRRQPKAAHKPRIKRLERKPRPPFGATSASKPEPSNFKSLGEPGLSGTGSVHEIREKLHLTGQLNNDRQQQSFTASLELQEKLNVLASERGEAMASPCPPQQEDAAFSTAWQQPGAYPLGGDVEGEDDDFLATIQSHLEAESHGDASVSASAGILAPNNDANVHENRFDLAVPNPVASECFQVAEEFKMAASDATSGNGKDNNKSKKCLVVFALVGFLAMIGAFLLVFFLMTGSKLTGNHGSQGGPLAVEDLAFFSKLPNDTQEEILQNPFSPQAEAADWILNDPLLDNYNDHQLTQRFSLATLYYATNGHNWKNQGGPNITKPKPKPQDISGGAKDLNTSVVDDPRGAGIIQASGLSNHNPPQGGSPPIPTACSSGLHRSLMQQITGKQPQTPACEKPWKKNPPKFWMAYDNDECQWYSTAIFRGWQWCNEEGRYTRIQLGLNNLTGTIPPELALLSSSLLYVYLLKNSLHGVIPSELFQLSLLKTLDVSGNRLDGTIPTQIGLLTDATTVHLAGNKLTGCLPKEVTNLSALTKLMTVNNHFSGTLPDRLMPSLEWFDAGHNQFSGTLPTTLGMLPAARGLLFRNNAFQGNIPSELGKLSNLTDLGLEHNQLSSSIPSQLGLLTNLIYLNVNNNTALSGTLPLELVPLAVNYSLYLLDITGTDISGTIPPALCDYLRVFTFDCSEKLCGCDCPCHF